MKPPKRRWIEPSREMWPVLKELKGRGIWFTVHTPEHLKVGMVNYWPRSGRIYVDGAAHSLPRHGFAALLDCLEKKKRDEADQPSSDEPRAGGRREDLDDPPF